VMPPYPWLVERSVDAADVQASVRALRAAGVPYGDADVEGVAASMRQQGEAIVARLAAADAALASTAPDREIIALIAYLQRLGVDGRNAIEQGLTAPSAPAEASQ